MYNRYLAAAEPVSYTHLDVYKRQVEGQTSDTLTALRGSYGKVDEQIVINLYAVSYTHLFPAGFTCPLVLWILLAPHSFHLRDYHPVSLLFPKHSVKNESCILQS